VSGKVQRNAGSFRDPSGFIFTHNNEIFRYVSPKYREHYDLLMESGLYRELADTGCIIPHREVPKKNHPYSDAYKIIKPDKIPFISYPYEWCFSQLKDAALALLHIRKKAFDYGMDLRDASAYNMQFYQGKPVLMDTLSFEKFIPGTPWTAYRQFCQHFLAPLALMSSRDGSLGRMLSCYIDGIPLDIASALLPASGRLKGGQLIHIHLHAKSQARYSGRSDVTRQIQGTVGRNAYLGLIDSLESAVKKMHLKKNRTTWDNYYAEHNYSDLSFEEKKKIVSHYIDRVKPSSLWDMGANRGEFSRLASGRGIPTVAFDMDHNAVEQNYLHLKGQNENHILPLVQDLTTPSPDIGWHNKERASLIARGPADTALALALVHHLAIGNNVPLENIAAYFADICRSLIIEFVPKSDSQVQRLLQNREDIFDRYDIDSFKKDFSRFFTITKSQQIQGTERTLFLMKRKKGGK